MKQKSKHISFLSLVGIRLFLFVSMLIISNCAQKPAIIKLTIQPFDDIETVELDQILKSINKTFDLEVVVLEHCELPKSAFLNIKSPRYRADSLIIYLIQEKAQEADYIFGITSKDISITKYGVHGKIKEPAHKYQDWGVFGAARLGGPSCILSTYRLKGDPELYLDRLSKISIHELGHVFGLAHCKNTDCIMQDAAESIKTIDNVKMIFCDVCKSKISQKLK